MTETEIIKIINDKITIHPKKYIKIIQNLKPDEYEKGSRWLFDIEQSMVQQLSI